MSFWGGEPTLNWEHYIPTIPLLLKTFPDLTEFSVSSNMIRSPEHIINFIKAFPIDRKLSFDLQISIDGDKSITDGNRGKGSTDKIISHTKKLITYLNDIDLGNIKLRMHTKPTSTAENIAELIQGNRVEEFYSYLGTFANKCENMNTNKNVSMNLHPHITLALPGKYTVQDGKNFAILLQKNKDLEGAEPDQYTIRLAENVRYGEEMFSKPQMFTCCAGQSSLQHGSADDLHICSHSLFTNEKGYDYSSIDDKISTDRIKAYQKYFIADRNKPEELIRMLYSIGGYHYYSRNRINHVVGAILELAKAGQVDEIFLKDKNYAIFFSMFLNKAFSCPINGLWRNSSATIIPFSIIKIMGNGAFQVISKNVKEMLCL
jgi:sulfatase maturation enzyme AslB (radical SAM superfamily)